MTRIYCLAMVSMGALLAGCQSSAPTTRNFSHLRLPAVTRDAAFDTAAAALEARFPIAQSDRASGTITSGPVETREQPPGSRMTDAVTRSRRVRRLATVRVTGTEDAAEVWCKVVVEQHDTDAVQLFANDMARNDAPTGTAADRDAATTPEQNEVWRTLRRDKLEERAVLRAVQDALAGPQRS